MKKLLAIPLILVIFTALSTASAITWSPNLPFALSSYNTTVQSSQYWYFASFSLNGENLTFYNTQVNGAPLFAFSIGSTLANITFNQLSASGETRFTANSNGTITLTGFGQTPENVAYTNNYVIGNSTLTYTYTSSNDTLNINPTLYTIQEIAITYPNDTTLSAIALAVIAILLGLVGIALVIFWRSRRREDDD